MKRLVLELEDGLHQQIKEKAVKQGKSMRQVLTVLLEKWLKEKVNDKI